MLPRGDGPGTQQVVYTLTDPYCTVDDWDGIEYRHGAALKRLSCFRIWWR